MSKRILITGGSGFIGAHVADELLNAGHEVSILDRDCPPPGKLRSEVRFHRGCIEDAELTADALNQIDAVIHLAAQPDSTCSPCDPGTNAADQADAGTAVLLEALLRHPVDRFVVASGMNVYGEGLYRNLHDKLVPGRIRSASQLEHGEWELHDTDGTPLVPIATPESKPLTCSPHALRTIDRERMCLLVGRAYEIPTTVLRFFTVYGPHQSNPRTDTGALGLFASQLLRDAAPTVFEDGQQRRDFVHVLDAARACLLALTASHAPGQVFNIGTGRDHTIADTAAELARALGRHTAPEITQRYRVGDVRHCFADISAARRLLGYEPQIDLSDGLANFASWLERHAASPRPARSHRLTA